MPEPIDFVADALLSTAGALNGLRAAVEQAVECLQAEHVPFRYDGKRVTDRNAVGCRACYPGDSSWPCHTRSVADELQAAYSGRNNPLTKEED